MKPAPPVTRYEAIITRSSARREPTKKIAASRKPNSVHAYALARVGAVTTIPLASPLLTRSSDRPGGFERAAQPPYLVLLRAGFCLPPTLPSARCALTAPFHPYSPSPCGLRRSRPIAGLATP